MRVILFLCVVFFVSCGQQTATKQQTSNESFAGFLENYYREGLSLHPLEATRHGVRDFNDRMYPEFTDGHRAKLRDFYNRSLKTLQGFNREELSETDQISYEYVSEYATLLLKDLSFRSNLIPTDQLWGQHLYIGQWATGSGAQPFATVRDYDNWIGRITMFADWMDSAVVYFRRGADSGYTLPKPLVRSMIPQFEYMTGADPEQHHFWGPVRTMPSSFNAADKERLTTSFRQTIGQKLVPAYQRMANFLKNEYLPKARESTTGISALPDGAERYKLMVKLQTTTNKTPEEIYETGLAEVKRIRTEMERVKDSLGFNGDLTAFFNYLKTDKQFRPFRTPEDVLNAYRSIQSRIEPHLKNYFTTFPKTPFEIRRTEEFRQASASAEYIRSPDGVKPGIFYAPIIDATQYNITSGMESLFLHEAIPGHHYQTSLQWENKNLPSVRRNDDQSNAYVEGWALYCESLGRQLGLYRDPYQYMGALGDEIHRAIRLVVDVALHAKGMTREEAIRYMMDNEQISEQGAIAEVERYIAGPGQALGYKIGSLKIQELIAKYKSMLGDKFSLQAFHDEFLKDGSMPLTVLEKKMDRWAGKLKVEG
jgi:uncharacterized protein (DUF885 family)